MRNETRHYRTKVKRAKKYIDPLAGIHDMVSARIKMLAEEKPKKYPKPVFGGRGTYGRRS